MVAPTGIRQWLTAVAVLQGTVVFLIFIGFLVKIQATATDLRDSLLKSNVAVNIVDHVNEEFSSILSVLVWCLFVGLVITGVSFSLLRNVISRDWPKPTSIQGDCSESPAEPSTLSKRK
jgi:hypothetical protein